MGVNAFRKGVYLSLRLLGTTAFLVFLSCLAFGQPSRAQMLARLDRELKTGDDNERKKAALDLATVGKDGVLVLIGGLKHGDQSPEVLGEIADSLCILDKDAVEPLISLLGENVNTKDILVLRYGANALACIAEVANDDVPGLDRAVPILMKDLENGRPDDWANIQPFTSDDVKLPKSEIDKITYNLQGFDAAAHCLGRIGRRAKDSIPLLLQIAGDEKYRTDAYRKIDSVNLILNDLIRTSDYSANKEIDRWFLQYENALTEKDRRSVERRLDALKKIQANQSAMFIGSLKTYASLIALATLPLTWLLIFIIKPIWLLNVYEGFPLREARLPSALGAISVPLEYCVDALVFRPRVLDAWVVKYLTEVRESFSKKGTVRDRKIHVPMGCFLDGRLKPELTTATLRKTFNRNQARVLIAGGGGTGKTSLACQMGYWAMAEDRAERLQPHAMLPILLEDDFVDHGEEALINQIAFQLRDSIDAKPRIPKDLLHALLENKRLLVMIDGMSEMNERTRHAILSGMSHSSINAIVITSRIDETIGHVNRTTVVPATIQGNQLSSFVEAYLVSRGKKHEFDDEAFFEGCRVLSTIVRNREITVLLAKLFVDQMIEKDLPRSIAELMQRSIELLYDKTPSPELSLADVMKAATIIAWDCLRVDYRPLSADYDSVRSILNETIPEGERCVGFLKDKLLLVETTSFGKNIRFKIDPLAEYLAGLHLVEENDSNDERWDAFFEAILSKNESFESIESFLLAVLDCCWTSDGKARTPIKVIERLSEMTNVKT